MSDIRRPISSAQPYSPVRSTPEWPRNPCAVTCTGSLTSRNKMACTQCHGIESEFDTRLAQRELRRYRRRGPTRSTKLLLEALEPALTPDSTLLDIGGGVGAIHHEMLDAGAVSAVHVDASPAYIAAASEEATRRHHLEAVEFIQGDFVTLSPGIAPVEIVTLDR